MYIHFEKQDRSLYSSLRGCKCKYGKITRLDGGAQIGKIRQIDGGGRGGGVMRRRQFLCKWSHMSEEEEEEVKESTAAAAAEKGVRRKEGKCAAVMRCRLGCKRRRRYQGCQIKW
jgi:hypothetical protein